jgi:acetyl esterase/lipase
MKTSRRTLIAYAALIVCLLAAPHAFAQKRLRAEIPSDVEVVSGVEFGKGGERPLKLDIVRPRNLPAEPMPVVIWVHGGGWRGGGSRGGISRLTSFAQRGYFCASIEYRVSGEAVFPAQIEDCKCAIRFLRAKAKEYHLDPDRIGVWGGSAGGHLVSLLGTTGDVKALEGSGGYPEFSSRVQAVCNWCGPSDMVKMLETSNANGQDAVSKLIGGSIAEKKEVAIQASPITYVSENCPPFLIMHGENDRTVPIDQSKTLHEALKKAGVESTLHIIENTGHGVSGPEHDKVVAEFFDQKFKVVSKSPPTSPK